MLSEGPTLLEHTRSISAHRTLNITSVCGCVCVRVGLLKNDMYMCIYYKYVRQFG